MCWCALIRRDRLAAPPWPHPDVGIQQLFTDHQGPAHGLKSSHAGVEYAVQLSSGDWPGWHYHKRGSSLWRVLPRATKVANQLRIYASVLQISIESIHHRGSGTISTYRDADVPANTRSSLTNSTAEADVRNRWIGQVLAMSFPRCHLLC